MGKERIQEGLEPIWIPSLERGMRTGGTIERISRRLIQTMIELVCGGAPPSMPQSLCIMHAMLLKKSHMKTPTKCTPFGPSMLPKPRMSLGP